MFGWFKKDAAPRNGPDFRAIDSLAKAQELERAGQLQKMLLLPVEFGGQDIPPNWVLVPKSARVAMALESQERTIDAHLFADCMPVILFCGACS